MKLRLIPFAVMAAMVASCSTEDEIAVNPDPRGDAISFSTAVGHSRATETTFNNLGDFRVVAKGVHPDGHIYENYLIGAADGGENATKEGSSNIWKLDHSVYWPTSTPYAVFWAYTFAQSSGTNKAVLPEGVKFSFDVTTANKAKLTGFSPVKNALTPQAGEYNEWNDGENQTDMLVAFTSQKRADNPSNVDLEFKHVLSPIRIQAKSTGKSSTDHRIVKIKGAWLVNAKDKADFTAAYSWNDNKKEASVIDAWENLSFKSDNFSAYGSFFRTPVVLGKEYASESPAEPKLLVDESLMLIPQTLVAWNKNQNDAGAEADNNGGAYILLLCRVELEHEGTTHNGSVPDDVNVKDGKHYHQQFPVNAANKYSDAQYGFVCVPVATQFEANKKYLFTLDICGAASGAGNYPPDLNEKFKTLVPKAADDNAKYDKFKPWTTSTSTVNLEIVDRAVKNVGDAVLDAPIQFSVTVSDWPKEWTDASAQF